MAQAGVASARPLGARRCASSKRRLRSCGLLAAAPMAVAGKRNCNSNPPAQGLGPAGPRAPRR